MISVENKTMRVWLNTATTPLSPKVSQGIGYLPPVFSCSSISPFAGRGVEGDAAGLSNGVEAEAEEPRGSDDPEAPGWGLDEFATL